MFLNSILIFLGVMTILLGGFNLITGSYIWGTLFILGGCWSIGLGIFYIVQDEKEKKREKAKAKTETETASEHPIDEGLLTQDLFEVDELTRQLINNESSESELDTPSEQSGQDIGIIIDLDQSTDEGVDQAEKSETSVIEDESSVGSDSEIIKVADLSDDSSDIL